MQIRDIAKKLNLSVATVSRALNPETQSKVRPQTLERVKRYVKQVGYVLDPVARGLSKGKTNVLGILLPTQFDSLFFRDQISKVIEGVYKILKLDGRYTSRFIFPTRGYGLQELSKQDITGIDGLLVSCQCDCTYEKSSFFPKHLLKNWNKPVVALNPGKNRTPGLSYVTFDQSEAARLGASYLIQKGHTKIGLIWGKPKHDEHSARYAGFEKTLKDHQVEINKNFIIEGPLSIEAGYEATLKLLNRKGPKPTAIFCLTDEIAMGALNAIRALRFNCPKDVAVVGFDGIIITAFIHPRLTTVGQPIPQLAEDGTQLLIDLIEGRVKGPITKTIEAQLLIRDST